MVRQLTPNRWNWSQMDEKWVYIELTQDGNKKFYYQLNPPQEFIDLTYEIKLLNDKLVACKNPSENDRIFNKMVKISKRMQSMGRND